MTVMEPIVNKVRSMNSEMLQLQKRFNRAKTSGSAGGVEVKITGQGSVEVNIGSEYKLSAKAKEQLSADLSSAVQQALEKHKKRVTRESSKILKNNTD